MTPIDYNNPNDQWLNTGYDYDNDDDDERIASTICHIIGICIGIFVAFCLCAMLGSCTTTKYVPVPEYHTDTVLISHNTRDSIYVHDSTFVKVDGDTVLIEKWHTRWRDRWQHDTIYQSKTDSIPYPVEVTKEVPAQLTWWQQARMHVGGIVIYGILIILTIKLYRKYAKP